MNPNYVEMHNMQNKHAVVYGLLSNLDEIEVSPRVDIVACTSRSCSCNHDFFSVVACPIKSNATNLRKVASTAALGSGRLTPWGAA